MNKHIIHQINKLAYPVLLNYLLLNVFEMLDKAIIGRYSVEGFALIGVVAPPIFEITGALGVLSAAFHIQAADLMGKGLKSEFEALFIVSKRIALTIGGTFVFLGLVGGRLFFKIIYGQTGTQLEAMLSYFYPNTLTVLLNMLIFMYSVYYRNKLQTKISFYSTAISTLVNLFFDFCLVHGYLGMPELGIAGAGWGSVIGLLAGLLVYQIPYFRRQDYKSARKKHDLLAIKNVFRIYPVLLGQEFLEGTLFTLVLSAAVSRLGIAQMAVYNLLDSIVSIISVAIYAYSTATQTYALQQRAAGNLSQTRIYLKSGCGLTTIVMLFLCLMTFVFRHQMMHWIIADTSIISSASAIIPIAFVQIFPKVVCQIYMEYLQGREYDKYVFGCTAVATLVTSIVILLAVNYFQLLGIYFTIASKYLVLSIFYVKKVGTVDRTT